MSTSRSRGKKKSARALSPRHCITDLGDECSSYRAHGMHEYVERPNLEAQKRATGLRVAVGLERNIAGPSVFAARVACA